MYNTKFESIDNLMNFLTKTSEFQDWEVLKFRISTPNGINLNMDTKIVDTLQKYRYTPLKNLKGIINNFYENNKHTNINIDIKIILPHSIKPVIDPGDEYRDFFIDFFTDSYITIITTSHLEKSKNSSLKPLQNWEIYVEELLNKWRKQNGYINQ